MGGATAGIDFGTSTTLVAIRQGLREEVLRLGDSNLWLPSVVEVFDEHMVVGEAAEGGHPERVVRSIKRSITAEQSKIELVTGEVADVDDIISAILGEAISRARLQGHDLTSMPVQLGCPAIWCAPQRRRLAQIANRVGLEVDVPAIIDEPIAAGIAWVEHRWSITGERPRGRVLVFDSGGGTLDVALLHVAGESEPEITVLSLAGLDEAGDAVDDAIAADLTSTSTVLHERHAATRSVTMAARELKERLSLAPQQTVLVTGEPPVAATYRREDLERQIEPQLRRAAQIAQAAVRAGRARELLVTDTPSDIRTQPWESLAHSVTHVLLSGGTSAIPAMQQQLAGLFPQAEIVTDKGVTSTQASVVSGLAYADTYGRLNLPRPALSFSVVFRGRSKETGETTVVPGPELYRAFDPLYSPAAVLRGETSLGYEQEFSYPEQLTGSVEAILTCEAVDRDRTPVGFRVGGERHTGVAATMTRGSTGFFKLYLDGRILWTGERRRGTRVVHSVERWPTLRGDRHDWSIELQPPSQASPMYHDINWWQFK